MIGVLLAGGQSRRFGSPKAFAKVEHRYFYEVTYEALTYICEKVIVVAREEHLSRFPPDVQVITDCEMFRGEGPLAGIYSAMVVEDAAEYIVLPCDMPFMNGQILKNLSIFRSESMVTAVKGHPLVSIWKKDMKINIKEYLMHEKRSVRELLTSVDATWIDAKVVSENPCVHFQNINQPL